MMKFKFFLLAFPFAAYAANPGLDKKIQVALEKSIPRMACNLSAGAPGSIIASPEAEDPDYYFHWTRDSSLVAESLTRLLPFVRSTKNETRIRSFMRDYANFSIQLQNTQTPYGPGETRFHVDGSLDDSKWPRPQYDGIALRAITILDYLENDKKNLDSNTIAKFEGLAQKDLENVAKLYRTKGFDLWEYANGFHFYTRIVQRSALLKGQRYFSSESHPEWKKASDNLQVELRDHWRPEIGAISRAKRHGEITDSDGAKIEENITYDTSISLAVNHAALGAGEFGDLDKRIWATLWQQQDYFLKNFPVNAKKKLGPTIGRGAGDDYYGGNAFFFLTAAFAEHDFRTAILLGSQKGTLIADKERRSTLGHVLQGPVKAGFEFQLPNASLAEGFSREGDAFLETMLDVIPADGMMAEQMSKVDGSPVSAHDLTWSYASLLTAILKREDLARSTVDFSKLNFVCPDPKIGLPRKKSTTSKRGGNSN